MRQIYSTNIVAIIFFLLAAQALAQTEELGVNPDQINQEGWQYISMPFNYQNLQVPSDLWDTIKNRLRKDGAKESQIETFSVAPISIQVEIQSEDPLVMRNGINYRLLFIEGGGEIDLFNYIAGKGDFYTRFAPHLNDGHDFHVLYISDSPGKEVGRSTWGNGCGKIFDISKNSQRFLEDKGIKVTSLKRHYMHLMAGTFIFFQLVEEKLFLGYIRIQDSRYPNFSCKAT